MKLSRGALPWKWYAWPVVVAFALISAGAPPLKAAGTSDLRTLTINSTALGGRTNVNILLPDGYATSARRYPVLYLLHGYGESYSDWVQQSDVASLVHDLPLIVVMPDGATGWYMDPLIPGPNWETYHIKELIPYIDQHFRTLASRDGRAIAGLSMGGMGAMAYAARHPDLFVAAASFSGVLDPEHFSAPGSDGQMLSSSMIFEQVCDQSAYCVLSHDPVALAFNLRGVQLFLSAGNGSRGPLDSSKSSVPDQTEVQVHRSLVSMARALANSHVPAVVDDYGGGTHTWPYWQRELHKAMPMLMAALMQPHAPQYTWSYRTADTSASVWGYAFSVGRQGDGFTDLTNVGPQGFTLTGYGTVSLVTAGIYQAGQAYAVTRNAGRPTLARAAADGSLHIAVQLGNATSTVTMRIRKAS